MADSRSDETLRQYLLGSITEESQLTEIELRLLSDDDYFEALLLNADDLTDEYLCGALTPAERESYERHFLSTPERERRLKFAKTLRKRLAPDAAREPRARERETRPAPDPVPRPNWWAAGRRVPAMRLAAVALLLACAGLAAWRFFPRESGAEQGLAALRSAYRGRRPVEARVSFLDEHAPFVVTRGGGGDAGAADYTERDRAESLVRQAARDDPGADSYHALGSLYLAKSQFDEAIDQFERALKIDERDARVHADLGAALLERGKARRAGDDVGGSAEDFARSLEHLGRALELDGSLHAALFNRALCYEQSQMPAPAAADWELYLQKDPGSSWAEEARRHLKALKERAARPPSRPDQLVEEFVRARAAGDDESAWALLSQNRDQAGGRIENALLDAHLEAGAAGRAPAAEEYLGALDYAARLNEARAGDRHATDLVRFYRALAPPRRAALAQARGLLRQGRARLVEDSDPEGAARLYEAARAAFERHGNAAEAAYVLYSLGHCYLGQLKSESGRAAFKEAVRFSEAAGYRSLLAQSLGAVANVEIGLNNYSDAIERSTRSLELSEQIGDTNGVMKALTQLGQEYLYLGDYRRSLALHRRSLDLAVTHSPEQSQLWRNYYTIAEPLNLLGLHGAAAEYMKEALRLALALDSRQLACRSYIDLSVIQGRRGDYEEATRNVRLAFELADTIESHAARAESLAYSSLQLGHLRRRAGDFAGAVTNYDRVIRLYDELDPSESSYLAHFGYAARKGRLLACLGDGECASAAQEIEATLSIFERYREKILEERHRNTFFDTEQDICDVAIDYAYSRRADAAATAAFDYAERCRARSLLDMMGARPQALGAGQQDVRLSPAASTLPAAELAAQLPRRAQVLQYAVLADKVLIWVVRAGVGTESRAVAIPREELEALTHDYLREISTAPRGVAGDAARPRAERLYDLLLKPVEQLLDRSEQVCVVPDRALNLLPFSALASAETGRYAVEDFTFTSSPSTNAFVNSSRLAGLKGGEKAERLLSVGDPRFDRKAFGSLADLPAARREAKEVAALYGARAVVGEQATEGLTVREMKGADVAHLALHSVADEDSPMRSKLLLAKGAGGAAEDGLLSAHEVYAMGEAGPRLVVLSACRSGVERYYGGEGMVGMARAFIAARVPLVVASLWAVESEATAELMIDFHRARSGDKASAGALREAQRKMLADPSRRHPYYWASFVTIGGHADF